MDHRRNRLRNADFCVTGEGRLDRSSFDGKAAVGVARACRQMNVPCSAIVGSCASAELDDPSRMLFREVRPIQAAGMSLDEAVRRARELIEKQAAALKLTS